MLEAIILSALGEWLQTKRPQLQWVIKTKLYAIRSDSLGTSFFRDLNQKIFLDNLPAKNIDVNFPGEDRSHIKATKFTDVLILIKSFMNTFYFRLWIIDLWKITQMQRLLLLIPACTWLSSLPCRMMGVSSANNTKSASGLDH